MNREMNNKVEWGVLGVSDLAVKKVIPAMRRGEWSQVAAIASRDLRGCLKSRANAKRTECGTGFTPVVWKLESAHPRRI